MKKSIKLLHVSNMYPSSGHTTYGIFVKRFEDAVESQGVVIAARSVISGKGRSAVTKAVKYLRFYASILWNVATTTYDVLYVHYISNSSPLLFFLKPFIKKPFVVNFHGGDLLLITGLEKYTAPITEKLIRKANLLVVPSGYFREEVVRRYNIPVNRIHVYPSGGVDTGVFRPLDRTSLRVKYGLEGLFVFGFVSRIDKGKRWDAFLRSVQAFGQRNPDLPFKAVVVGNGLELSAFLALAKQLELNERLLFLGEQAHDELPAIYNVLDALVFATDNESLGLVGIEGMACGTIVLGSYVGGIQSYLVDGENGFALHNEDDDSIVRNLERVFRLTPTERELLRERGFATAAQFDAQLVTSQLSDALRSLVK